MRSETFRDEEDCVVETEDSNYVPGTQSYRVASGKRLEFGVA